MTRTTRFRLLAVILVTVGLLAPYLGPSSPASAIADVRTDRLGGANRFETAAAIARAGHPSARTALIANGANFPDALAGSYLAGAVGAPILLVLPNAIPQATTSALQSIGATDVVLLGGPAAISPGVEAQFRQNYGVTRVAGDDRYKTAVEVARRGAIGGVGTVDGLRTAFLTTGQNFPDALGAGPLAYDGRLPVFLTRNESLPAEVAQALRDLNIEHIVILGGTQAVSAAVESQAKSTGATTERLSGRNRAETATLVANFALARLSFDGVNVVLARGDDYPDALAGGPLGGVRRAVILLTATPTQLAVETRNWLEDHFGTVARITALGGTAAISDAVLREAELAAETNNLPPGKIELTISGGSMNGGPEWQYQESDASPSKALTISALVTSDSPQGSEGQRVPAAREDVVVNIRPTQGDNAANGELNFTVQTDANGVARVSYTRGQPGTDTITVRLADDPGISDAGVGRWNTDTMPMSLAPDTAQVLQVNQDRSFTACRPGPTGSSPPATPTETQFHLTTLELLDDNPSNNTNTAALRFGSGVTDDRADSDQTIAKVTASSTPSGPSVPNGCVTFTIGSNSAQIFTLMAFIDDVITPAANDDNTNPTEYRDVAGLTTFTSNTAGLNMTPANDNNSSTTITRRNGQQIVYRVTSVDSQGQPNTSPVDVGFEQLTDADGTSTTTAEFDWFDSSANPSQQEGSEDQIPGSAQAVGSGTTRIQVTPNAQGVFTFAITNSASRDNPTAGNPLAWIDIQGGRDNLPDNGEAQARGENFSFSTSTRLTASLEFLGCPPGTDQRGWTAEQRNTGTPGNNPFDSQDPCLGKDVVPAKPHAPWPLTVAPESAVVNAATSDTSVISAPPSDLTADPSRGDVVVRLTLRDATGAILRDNPATAGDEGNEEVTFRVTSSGTGDTSVAPNRPNPGSNTAETTINLPVAEFVVTMLTRNGVAEIVIDRNANSSSTTPAPDFVSANVDVLRGGAAAPVGGLACPGASNAEAFCKGTARWADIDFDTTEADAAPSNNGVVGAGLPPGAAPAASCPSGQITPPCFNGALVSIDKARDSYVMGRGGQFGGTAYVVYAVGGGGKLYGGTAPRDPKPGTQNGNALTNGERPVGSDVYFIDGLGAAAEQTDNDRCGYFSSLIQAGCARFDNALTFDDRMVYEFSGTVSDTTVSRRTQRHSVTNGTSPVSN